MKVKSDLREIGGARTATGIACHTRIGFSQNLRGTSRQTFKDA
ncbi:MAG: hypothetical protein ABI146_06520 [Nitrobacter sp.]